MKAKGIGSYSSTIENINHSIVSLKKGLTKYWQQLTGLFKESSKEDRVPLPNRNRLYKFKKPHFEVFEMKDYNNLFLKSKSELKQNFILNHDDIFASLSILLHLWPDEKTLEAVQSAKTILNKISSTASKKRPPTTEFFKQLNKVGLDEVLYELAFARHNIKSGKVKNVCTG